MLVFIFTTFISFFPIPLFTNCSRLKDSIRFYIHRVAAIPFYPHCILLVKKIFFVRYFSNFLEQIFFQINLTRRNLLSRGGEEEGGGWTPDCNSKQRIERIFFIILLFRLPPSFFLALHHREIKYSAGLPCQERELARISPVNNRRPWTTKTLRCRWPPNFLSVVLSPWALCTRQWGWMLVLSCGTYPRPCAIKANLHRFLWNIPSSTKFIYIYNRV